MNQQRKIVVLHFLRVAEFFEAVDLLFQSLVKLSDTFLEAAVEVVNHFGAVGPQFSFNTFHSGLEVLVTSHSPSNAFALPDGVGFSN